MPCYSPLRGYRSRFVNPETGKRGIVFDRKDAFTDLEVEFACGQCIGCRLERSRQWAIRCVHEASLYERNCFITLTYDNEHLPSNGSLVKRDFQLFMKSLRKKFGSGIRYFHCGEYGDEFGRPHYHAVIFNHDFEDKKLFKVDNGHRLYTSDDLSELWPVGHSLIGDVTFQSAAYVARYLLKKITGKKSDEHYEGRQPEYTTMSRRPGIGRGWFDQYSDDLFPSNFVVHDGKKMKIPVFYDRIYEIDNPESFQTLKNKRRLMGKQRAEDNSLRRLAVKEKVKLASISTLQRKLERSSND